MSLWNMFKLWRANRKISAHVASVCWHERYARTVESDLSYLIWERNNIARDMGVSIPSGDSDIEKLKERYAIERARQRLLGGTD